MRVDGDLAGSSSVTVNGGAHVLPGHDGADLLLGRDVLSGSSLPQGVEGEGGVAIHLRAGEQLASPAEQRNLSSAAATETCFLARAGCIYL